MFVNDERAKRVELHVTNWMTFEIWTHDGGSTFVILERDVLHHEHRYLAKYVGALEATCIGVEYFKETRTWYP